MCAISTTWHVTIPLILQSSHVRVGMLLGVSHQLDAIVHASYSVLGPLQRLSFVCSAAERLFRTGLFQLFDHVAKLPTADEIASILVASSSERYWMLIGSLGEDGRLWMFLDREWDMRASKHRTHALAMASVINRPCWLSILRKQVEVGHLTPTQFTNMRLAIYTRVLRTLDQVTDFHNSLAEGRV